MFTIDIPSPNVDAINEVKMHWAKIDEKGFSLGVLERMIEKLAGMGELPEEFNPGMVLMCGDHGVMKYKVSAFPQEVTLQMINGYLRKTAGATVLARHAKSKVYICDVGTAFDLSNLKGIYDYKVAWGTNDFTQGPAMSEEQAIKAIQAGIDMANMCIDKGHNLLYTGEMGIGNTTATAAIAAAFMGIDSKLTVGRGSGINDERLKIKQKVVADGIAFNKPEPGNALDVLCKVGGYDHAGLCGVVLGAAARGVPVMIDGVNATAGAILAYGINPKCREYMLCSHLSSDLSHRKMLELLRLYPIIDAGMRLGEGTGASVAIPVLAGALKVYKKLIG
ncbi:MAG: nicotinate-nucleotide--dimethylbenzimidazole phosphoribosyltransferase [Phascolarctobacterium sp.]|nr:nicotinate-nucleotide--dimethylbenzimidazole phosphoribosyltransferase [Phascolarctobacterium sp.]